MQGEGSVLGVHIPAKGVFISILSIEFQELFANNLLASI